MKRLMLAALALACLASTAFAQAGSIGVFSSPNADTCDFIDMGGLVPVYINHVYTAGATASQFMLAPPPTWVHLGDTWNFTTVIGSSVGGVSIAYGACLSGNIALGVVNFFGNAAPLCTYFGIIPDPAALSGQIEGADCATPVPNKIFPTGGAGRVNPDHTCYCSVPVHETSWGQVKALYR